MKKSVNGLGEIISQSFTESAMSTAVVWTDDWRGATVDASKHNSPRATPGSFSR